MSFLDNLLGRALATSEQEDQKIGVREGVPTLGLDGLSSAAYGPEAALAILLPLGTVGVAYLIPVTGTILALLAVLYFSYRQTISAYPNGGGSYIVAKENLGTNAGLVAAAALMLDYVLNAAVGISAGVAALTSAFPALHQHTLALCLGTLGIIMIVNLRGTRESGLVFGVPTYLFIGSLGLVLLWGLIRTVAGGGHAVPVIAPPALPVAAEGVGLWLLLRAFASGCTAMTGVEAVSNGIGAFAAPAVQLAQRTLTVIVVVLGLLLAGIAWLCAAYHIGAMDQEQGGYQSVLSQLVAAVAGRGVVYYVTIGSVLVVLALSANTSFAGFPRLCQMISRDGYLPPVFGQMGRRLVFSAGIVILAGLAGALLVVFGGITDRLIPLFAVGAFGAFTLSQAGMVRHWQGRTAEKGARVSLTINATGAVATGVALAIILVAKFAEGAWVTLLIIPGAAWLFRRIKAHYDRVAREMECPRTLDWQLKAPLVVVPIDKWNRVTQRALRFGLRISPDVVAVHIAVQEDKDDLAGALRALWPAEVEQPAVAAGFNVPRLEVVESPFRWLYKPLWDFIEKLQVGQPPERRIAVIIPELIPMRWYEYLLHNHRAEQLKAALLLEGDQRIVVINIPWYTHEYGPDEMPAGHGTSTKTRLHP
jgi:amino acid transporter